MDAAERKDDDRVELCDVDCSGRDTLAREIMDSGIVLRCGCAVAVAADPLLSFAVAAVAADASAIPVHTYTSRKKHQPQKQDTQQFTCACYPMIWGSHWEQNAHSFDRNVESTSIKQTHAAASACVARKKD